MISNLKLAYLRVAFFPAMSSTVGVFDCQSSGQNDWSSVLSMMARPMENLTHLTHGLLIFWSQCHKIEYPPNSRIRGINYSMRFYPPSLVIAFHFIKFSISSTEQISLPQCQNTKRFFLAVLGSGTSDR